MWDSESCLSSFSSECLPPSRAILYLTALYEHKKGPTGSGKTTFLGQASLDLVDQGVNVLWGSFEIKNTRLMKKLLQQYMRDVLPMADHNAEMTEKQREEAMTSLSALADRFEDLPMYFMKFHGGSDVDDVIDAMECEFLRRSSRARRRHRHLTACPLPLKKKQTRRTCTTSSTSYSTTCSS